ncbi:hypothetical protein AXK12_02300 [Cephaloticoccus capnophilus]|uniref:Uncharacterized protein n=1 Tax=Cephaloticoccus capnophilus TaxID=1548208 RepID=A0A139SRD8_9BACT|nr:hypothetical protein [Cephaloticoccus capnophilus]KXU37092.1 hypothetical protein AXK12_02300 [Cephaloticoccus capnophilus]
MTAPIRTHASDATPTSGAPRKKILSLLRLLSAFCLVFGIVYWSGKGAHTGWSMNRVPVTQVDEITGIEFITYEDRFVPGIEWLGGAVGLAAVAFGLSFFFRTKKTHNP